MNNVKILHCADVHIGAEASFLGFKAAYRRRETLLTFEKIIDLCVENEVDVLLIAGDLFHSNNIERSFYDDVIKKIKSATKLKIVYIGGNHDPINPRSYFFNATLPENLYVLGCEDSCIFFPELNLRVYGRSFGSAFLEGKPSPNLIPPTDDIINISLIHGELGGNASSPYNAISKDYIENSKMDYIALGHIHKRTEINKIGNTFYAYSGCPEGQGFDELGDKGVLMGKVGKSFCDLKFVKTSRRKHIIEKIDVTEKNVTAEYILNFLEEKYGETYSENLYKIELIGNISSEVTIDFESISARLNEKVYFAKLKDLTDFVTDFNSLSKEKSLKGIFVKNMLKKISESNDGEKEKYEYALKLGLKAFNGEVKYNENQ